jgi:hypothetical protein
VNRPPSPKSYGSSSSLSSPLGWLTLDDAAANIIASAIGAILSVVLTVTVRAHVTPVDVTRPGPSN